MIVCEHPLPCMCMCMRPWVPVWISLLSFQKLVRRLRISMSYTYYPTNHFMYNVNDSLSCAVDTRYIHCGLDLWSLLLSSNSQTWAPFVWSPWLLLYDSLPSRALIHFDHLSQTVEVFILSPHPNWSKTQTFDKSSPLGAGHTSLSNLFDQKDTKQSNIYTFLCQCE